MHKWYLYQNKPEFASISDWQIRRISRTKIWEWDVCRGKWPDTYSSNKIAPENDILAKTNHAYLSKKAVSSEKNDLFDIWLPGTDSNRRLSG